MKRLLVAMALICTLSACDSPSSTSDYQSFQQACAAKGGFVSVVSSGFMNTIYGCIVNNQIVYLPGFS